MNFDVAGPCIESEQSEGAEAAIDAQGVRTDQDEVKVGDADVVPPDVNLFHVLLGSTRALELAPPH